MDKAGSRILIAKNVVTCMTSTLQVSAMLFAPSTSNLPHGRDSKCFLLYVDGGVEYIKGSIFLIHN